MDMWKFISKDGSIEKDATGRQNRIKKDFIMNGRGLGYYRSLAAVGSQFQEWIGRESDVELCWICIVLNIDHLAVIHPDENPAKVGTLSELQ